MWPRLSNHASIRSITALKIGLSFTAVFRHWIGFALLASFACCNLPASANEQADMARLDAIQRLADSDTNEGIKQLEAFKRDLSPEASPALRLETLNILVGLYTDVGQLKSADAAITEFLRFAQASKDHNAIALAQIADAQHTQNNGMNELAISKLNKIQENLKDEKNPEVQMRLHIAFGTAYRTLGKFELALSHFLEALRWTDHQKRRKDEAKIICLNAITGLYLNMRDPQKALDTASQGLSISKAMVSPRAIASLISNQGVAYGQLGKTKEARQSFEKVLEIGIEAKIPSMEATALVNLSDHFLSTRNYQLAENYARRAIATAESVDDIDTAVVAKANLGFALGGQGKISQGAALVNESIAHYRASGAKASIEEITGELAGMYERAGMYKEALTTVRAQQALSRELFNSNRSRVVSAMQEEFNADQRQKQIELLAKENDLKDTKLHNQRLQQIVALLGVLVAVMVGAVVYMLYRRAAKANQQLQEVNTKLAFYAVRDPLTGLHNRRSFIDLMQARKNVSEAERRQDSAASPDCMILMDIDEFKQINDTHGHAVGDQVLTEVARRLKSTVRDTDMILRWGGEEFLIFSPKANAAQITRLVERVLRAVGETCFEIGNLKIRVTVTAGFISLPFSGIPETECDWEKTLQIADMALFLGKAHGRNRAYGLGKLLVAKEQALPMLETDLAAAIAANMVEVIELIGPEVGAVAKADAGIDGKLEL